VEIQEKVGCLIQHLTHNEDYQQELWLHYLSGNPEDTLASYLHHLQIIEDTEELIKQQIWHYFSDSTNMDFLTLFSPYEQSIIRLVILGLTTRQIAEYSGIQEIRICQTITNLRYNDLWRTSRGTQKKIHR
jgi:hypothetical protein